MANHIKYHSEEERKVAMREYYREYRKKEVTKKGRDSVANPCKHKVFKYNDALKVDIGTLNRTYIDTAYMDIMVSIAYTNDEHLLRKFKDNVSKAFNAWLKGQSMWDKVNRIIVMDYAILEHKYNGQSKSFTIQLHVRRDEVEDWKSTVENLKVLADLLVEEIKKTCVETGLPLKKWKSNEVLTDFLSPGATEPEPC
jgi:hypothetical protein